MPEIRWILLGLGALLIAGIWWWGARKSLAARGRSETLRPDAGAVQGGGTGPGIAPITSAPVASTAVHTPQTSPARETRLSALEPLKISTTGSAPFDTDFEIPVMASDDFEPPPRSNIKTTPHDEEARMPPVMAQDVPAAAERPAPAGTVEPAPARTAEPAPVGTADPIAAPRAAPAQPAPAPQPAVRTDISGRFSRVPRSAPKPAERQKIVGLRVCAAAESAWRGADLAARLTALGLAHGRYGIFHRLNADARAIFCVASLIEPGTFDLVHMAATEFGGVTLFAVLPGVMPGAETFDEMLAAAQFLAESLGGVLQDDKTRALSAQRVIELREEILQFEQLLGAQRQG